MNKFKFYFILTITTLSLFSCSKNDTAADAPLRDYATQYKTDKEDIEEYLNNYYITVTNHPRFTDDQDVVFTKIPTGGSQPSIMSYKENVSFPKLLSRNVSLHDITYKLYYLVLRPGTGQSPCNVDGVLAAYKGDYLSRKTVETVTSLTATQFTNIIFPSEILDLFSYITGWAEIFPQFKTGTHVANNDGTVTFNDFGAGVMFVPSGLAYYNNGAGSIPSYAPLVFSFKLYEIQRADNDTNDSGTLLSPDGVPSYLEDLDGDGYVYDFRNKIRYPTTPATNPDDTDNDGIPDFLDIDDDNDNYSTKLEIKNPITGLPYLFLDIPDCSGNITNPARVKKYLDKNCH